MAKKGHGGRREKMKKNMHPEYVDTKVICDCGNTFAVKSNQEEIHLEVCDKCHPFYVGGSSKSTSKAGRIEKFNRKYGLNKKEA